jgi:hypothetical protein
MWNFLKAKTVRLFVGVVYGEKENLERTQTTLRKREADRQPILRRSTPHHNINRQKPIMDTCKNTIAKPSSIIIEA